jgi:pimeloyl-ACP methyl ester carboxylesterase
MPIAHVNDIDICYETYGSGDDEALVLINGLGSQMIRWPEGFRDLLVNTGFHVIAFDNRDVGLSTKFDDATTNPPYTVADMASDVIGLLDHLRIDQAHIVGQSMGGMIGQVVTIQHPHRVLSLASVMSAMGDDPVLSTDPDVVAVFSEPAATTREEAIEQDVRHRRVMSGDGFAYDEDAMRDLAAKTYDRCYAPAGRTRQMLAIVAASGRAEALSKLETPTVVIHGTGDRLVPFANGEKMATIVPGAELVAIDGMGHDLPRGAWDDIVSAIARNAKRG